MEDNKLQTAVIYARYSSHAQRDVSIEQQVREIRKFADAQGLNIIEVYTDRALSGTTDKRPEFQRMIADAEKRAFQYVVVYTLDRFARDRYDSAVYKRQLKTCGVRVLSAMENISDDPTGILMESMLEGLAEYYSKELSRKIVRGLDDNAGKCLVNGVLPYGYKRGEGGKFEVNEEQAEIVREIYRRIDKGETFTGISRDLNQRGITNKGGKPWQISSYNKLISNERYTGVYIYGKTRVEGGIPKIIDRELFDRVQVRLKTKSNPRNSPTKRRRENSVYLLTGKLYCGKCKSPMVGISGKSGAPQPHNYYVCQRRRKEKTCNKATVRRDDIELQVASALKEYAMNSDVIAWLADKTMEYFEENKESAKLSSLKTQLADTKKAKANILSAIEQGIITETTKDRLIDLETQESELAARISIEQDRGDVEITKESVIAFITAMTDGDVKDKSFQELLFNLFLKAVYLYDDHLKIIFTASGAQSEIDLPAEIESPDPPEGTYKSSQSPPKSRYTYPDAEITAISGVFVLTCPLK